MAKSSVSIVGLGVTGISVGLALSKSNPNLEIIGHDRDPAATQLARKLGAIRKSEWNLHAAVDSPALVVLAVPGSAVADTLALIKPDLSTDSLVLVLSDVFGATLAALAEQMPGHRYAAVAHPILTGIGGALEPRADLFEEATICLATSGNADPAAVELAGSFIESMGAQPRFMDAVEHDGLTAAVQHLPQLLGAIQLRLAASGPAWAEGQRLAGRTFAYATEGSQSAEALTFALQANRTQLVTRIEQLERELAQWKKWLAAPGDESGELAQAVSAAAETRREWEARAALKNWDARPEVAQAMPERGGFFRQLFFGNFGAKRQPPDEPRK